MEEIPRRFKLIETVPKKFTCAITRRSVSRLHKPRGFIGPQLLATIPFDKFGLHITLNRQSARFSARGSTYHCSKLADQVGHWTFAVSRSST
ncbi:transposase [Bradyrhizobium centrosematis]|nr:transposase [Bradyrhizobium centrosematis]MCS3778201.1 transposase [Bradyrhizobium centrosematis]